MDDNALKRFIVLLPSRLGYSDTESLKKCVYKALFYAATADGKYLSHLFPLITQDQIDELAGYEFPLALPDRRPFYTVKHAGKYTHAKGTACARSFESGDAVYQCQDCAFDETCVLCGDCFNPDDHQGHSVFSYYSRGTSSGMCDCGDPEAFVVSLNCKCSSSNTSTNNIPSDLQQSLRATIQFCLDYILDVTNFSILALPFIHDHIDTPSSPLTSLRLSNYSSLPSWRYGGALDNNSSNLWYLVLWNDEHHTVDQALKGILSATNMPKARAQSLTHKISQRGKAVILEMPSYSELLVPLRNAQLSGLVATICSARDYMRETIAEVMFSWLNKLPSVHDSITSTVKRAIADLLLQPNHQLAKVVPAEFIKDLSIDDERRCFENGLLFDGKFVNAGLCEVLPYESVSRLYKPAHLVLATSRKLDRLQNSRLQYFLSFEIRFPTKVRRKLGNFVVSHLISDPHTKRMFSDQFLELYPQLITTLCLSDREEELSIMSCISAQLLTCPATVLHILEMDQLGMIMGPVARLIEEHSARWNFDSGYPNLVDITDDKPETFRSIVFAIRRGIDDIRHILDKAINGSLQTFFTEKNLIILLMFLRNFQGYWSVKRKYGDHVEMEQMDFVVHRIYSAPVLELVQTLASIEMDPATAQNTIMLLEEFLQLRKVRKNAPGIPDFVVSREPVSFINPINSLLSYLFQIQGFQNFETFFEAYQKPFVNISDISLRSIVLAAQVNVGFWIRNGLSVARQASVYSNSGISDLTYLRDFHLNQIAAILDDPKATLFNFLDRWQLLDWFTNKVSHKETVYEERFSAIGEKFIIFLYNLLMDRSRFKTLHFSEWRFLQTQQEICYELCDGPKTYSHLRSSLSSEESDSKFDEILKECADYIPPSGLTDSGRYKLKDSMYRTLEPMSIMMEGSKYQDIVNSLRNQISQKEGIKPDEVILIPKFKPSEISYVDSRISRFAKTTDFAKLLYKFMNVSVDSSDEFYIMHVLHLLHAVILDDEYLQGTDFLNEAFVIIPLGDLLMTIVNSKMSPLIRAKAKYLLGIFMNRDPRVTDSLVDCFGSLFVMQYQEQKNEVLKHDSTRKRNLIEKRKARVMKKFAKQQEQFVKNNTLKNDPDMDVSSSSDSKVCILCGEPESFSDVFGILASTTESAVFWKWPSEGRLAEDALQPYGESADRSVETYGTGYTYGGPVKLFSKRQECKTIITTCGHGMHYKCFKRTPNRCPLCQSYQNIFLPTFIKPAEVIVPQEALTGPPLTLSYNEILESLCITKNSYLMRVMMIPEYIQGDNANALLKPLEEGLMASLRSQLDYRFDRNGHSLLGEVSLNELTDAIGATVRMHEIATRIEGNEAYANFLDMVPQLAKLLVKTLISARVFLGALASQQESPSRISEDILDSQLMVGSVVDEAVRIFFRTDETFQTVCRLGFTKSISIIAHSLIYRVNELGYAAPHSDRYVNPETLDELRRVFHALCDTASMPRLDFKGDGMLVNLYNAICILVLPFLRQMILFLDVLTSHYDTSSSTLISLPEITALKNELATAADADEIGDILCAKLQIPLVKQLILILAREDGVPFETRIHDNITCAKVPRYLDDGILALEYPGVVKLIDLPEDFSSFQHQQDNLGAKDFLICLACGSKVSAESLQVHAQECCRHAIYFQPRLNFLRISTRIGKVPVGTGMGAPYLTAHGEVKKVLTRGAAKLSHMRYHHLNKLWLNLGLYSYITRSISEVEIGPDVFETFEADEFGRGFVPI